MTLLELKEEFEKYLIDSSDYYTTKEPLTNRKLLQIWLDCADPREKKIQKLEQENNQLKTKIEILQMDMEKMKNSENCQTWNEWQCPYARNREKNYVHPNGEDCPCDKWKMKVVG